jgi:hypothetical protein
MLTHRNGEAEEQEEKVPQTAQSSKQSNLFWTIYRFFPFCWSSLAIFTCYPGANYSAAFAILLAQTR